MVFENGSVDMNIEKCSSHGRASEFPAWSTVKPWCGQSAFAIASYQPSMPKLMKKYLSMSSEERAESLCRTRCLSCWFERCCQYKAHVEELHLCYKCVEKVVLHRAKERKMLKER